MFLGFFKAQGSLKNHISLVGHSRVKKESKNFKLLYTTLLNRLWYLLNQLNSSRVFLAQIQGLKKIIIYIFTMPREGNGKLINYLSQE